MGLRIWGCGGGFEGGVEEGVLGARLSDVMQWSLRKAFFTFVLVYSTIMYISTISCFHRWISCNNTRKDSQPIPSLPLTVAVPLQPSTLPSA